MDIKKIEKRVKKISNLIELIKLDGKLSKIERDLLLDYVRKLYDDLLNSGDIAKDSAVDKANTHSEKKVKTEAPVMPVIEEVVEAEPEVEPIVQEVVEQKSVVQEVAQEVKAEVEEKLQPEVNAVVVDTSDSSYDELFVFDEIKDLSNKLGMAKIDDINKAIGINERIFTIKELFGGDNAAFSNTVSELNGTNSFEEAKGILISKVAPKYNWDDDKKFKKAQQFIKIVKRLYA